MTIVKGSARWSDIVTGTAQVSTSEIVLTISLPGGNVPVYLHADVPGRYSGSVAPPPVDATLTWVRTVDTGTGRLTIGSHPSGTFPLAAGSYGTTLQFTGNLFSATVSDGPHSLDAYGTVRPEDVVLTVQLPSGPVTLSFRSVGSQSCTGYGN